MERRRNIRTEFETHAYIDLGDDIIDCTVHDLSLSGCMVRLVRGGDLEADSDLVFHLTLGPDVVIESTAVVVDSHGRDCRLRFRIMDADSLAHLRRLMELNTADANEIQEEIRNLLGSPPTHRSTDSE